MIRRWRDYILAAYRPSIWVPYTVAWAVGLTALFASVTGGIDRWHPDAGLVITAVTLPLVFLLMRSLDDIRDWEYDSVHNPGRPLPSGMVSERDLLTLVGVGLIVILALNAGRGVALIMLAVQLAYAGTVIALDRYAKWPSPDRLALALAVNIPIQSLLSLYVYVGFLRAEHVGPNAAGFVVVVAVTIAALCLEFGRKVTRRPRPGERTYVTALGASGTSLAGLVAAALATVIVLATLTPWQADHAWGWLVLLPLALPALAVIKFAKGAARWPIALTVGYVPVMYLSFLAVGLLTKGAVG